MGGLALALYGSGRATEDLDPVVEADRRKTLVAFLEANGYETQHASEGYSNPVHSDPRLGRLDFVYVRGDTIHKLLSEVRGVFWPSASMKSSERSCGPAPLLDLEADVPTSREDLIALQDLRDRRSDPSSAWSWSAQVASLFPIPRRRTTSQGWEPFTL